MYSRNKFTLSVFVIHTLGVVVIMSRYKRMPLSTKTTNSEVLQSKTFEPLVLHQAYNETATLVTAGAEFETAEDHVTFGVGNPSPSTKAATMAPADLLLSNTVQGASSQRLNALAEVYPASNSSKRPSSGNSKSEPSPFHYTINAANICRTISPQDSTISGVFLLNFVHSAVGNFARRARVRQSWAMRSNYAALDRVETLFFVGLPSGAGRMKTQDAVEAESAQHGDIVQINIVDSYRNMTLKALAALHWTSKYCSGARYLLKADDDAFVNVFAVLKHIRDLAAAGFDRRLLMCLVWRQAPVARRGKWAVTPREFPRRKYPTYCCGLGYVVTADVVAMLLDADAAADPDARVVGNTQLGDVANFRSHSNDTVEDSRAYIEEVTENHHHHHHHLPSHAGNPEVYDDVTSEDDITRNNAVDTGNPHLHDYVTGGGEVKGYPHSDTDNPRAHDDVTTNDVRVGRRRLWIDDVYVTGILVESLGGRVRHVNMSAAYCKSDKMAAVYRHVTEWCKYVFTQVGDDEAHLYADTWIALRRRAASDVIPSPSVVRPGRLADRYIPLSTMLRLARNITRTRIDNNIHSQPKQTTDTV